MTMFRAAGGRFAPIAPLLVVLGVVVSCVPHETAATPIEVAPAQPQVASYNCGDGDVITVENLGALVHVVGADGSALDLPAAPDTQRSRYGAGADVIVIEGREALLMRGRQEPLTCTR